MLLLLRFLLAFALLCTSLAHAHVSSLDNMVQTASAFLAALDDQQLAKAKFPFEDEERFNWHFIPKTRKGLPLREMTPTQRHLAAALLSSGLSGRGYIKATEIMSLEDVLRVLEHGTGPVRDPEGYFFSVFGEPSNQGNWGFRIEGHHISQNFTLINGRAAGSPEFFGANPATVKQGPRQGLRVLAREEDLGRSLVESLSPDQRKTAIVSDAAYPDIFTMASREAALTGQPNGIRVSALTPSQQQLLTSLLEEYANNLTSELAAKRLDQIRGARNDLFFAWAGSTAPGQPHYYRVQAPAFLIEYDNTQNNANHIHSVWRDFHGDFGRDLLKEHYQTSADHAGSR